MGGLITQETFLKMIKELDKDGDGEVSKVRAAMHALARARPPALANLAAGSARRGGARLVARRRRAGCLVSACLPASPAVGAAAAPSSRLGRLVLRSAAARACLPWD